MVDGKLEVSIQSLNQPCMTKICEIKNSKQSSTENVKQQIFLKKSTNKGKIEKRQQNGHTHKMAKTKLTQVARINQGKNLTRIESKDNCWELSSCTL